MAVVFAQLITAGREPRACTPGSCRSATTTATPCAGVTIGDDGPKAGLNGVDNGRLTFDHVRVPRDDPARPLRPGRRGRHLHLAIENETRRFFTMLGTLVRGRVSVGGSAGSATKLALDIAVRYGDVRRQFAAPGKDREIVVNDYLVHQRKLLPALATTLRAALRPGRAGRAPCTTCRPRCTCSARRSTRSPARAGVPRGRAQGRRRPGTPRATIQTVPRGVRRRRLPAGEPAAARSRPTPTCSPPSRATTPSCCSWSRRACSPATATRSARWTAGARSASSPTWSARPSWSGRRPAALIARLVDAVPGRDDDVPMLDRGWQLKLFEFREKHALEGAIRRLRKNAATEGMEPFDMFNDVQDHVLRTAADAHRPRRARGVRRRHRADHRHRRPRAAGEGLRPLRAVDHRGRTRPGSWSTASSPRPAPRALTATVNSLLRELRPHMRTLVDAFAIPDAWLACAILEEEGDRQEAMAREDAAVRGGTATDLEVAPAQ